MKGIKALLSVLILLIISHSGSSKSPTTQDEAGSSPHNEVGPSPRNESVDIGNGEQTILYLPSKPITGIVVTCGGNGWGMNSGPENQFKKLANALQDTSIAVLQVAYKNPNTTDKEKQFKSTEEDLKLANTFIKEKLGDVERVFIGHSMGGGVAWQIAYLNPTKTVGLVTCGQSHNAFYRDAMKNMHDMPIHILIGDKEHAIRPPAPKPMTSVEKHERLLKIFISIRPDLENERMEIGSDVVFSENKKVGKVTKIEDDQVSIKEYKFEGFPVKISWGDEEVMSMNGVRAPKNLWMKFLKESTHSCEKMNQYLLSKPSPNESNIILKMFGWH